jgi:opacity protein-like surface antigen
MRRLLIAALSAVALTAAVASAAIAPPAVNTACAPGETGVTNGCAPFCLPGRYFDYDHTGLCLPVPAPPPTPPNGVVPQSVSM